MRKPLFEIFFDFFAFFFPAPDFFLPSKNQALSRLFHPILPPLPARVYVHHSGRIIYMIRAHSSARFISWEKQYFTNFQAVRCPIFVTLHNSPPRKLYRFAGIQADGSSALAL